MDPRADPLQLALLNRWQRDFPLSEAPFDELARQLGVTPDLVLARCEQLLARGVISRIGGVFGVGAGGASLLAAMAVPAAELDAVAARVSAVPGVNHNYQRDHRINLWFVLTGRDEAWLARQLDAIERDCGHRVLRLPMLQPYGVDLAFDLRRGQAVDPAQGLGIARPWRAGVPAVADDDRPLAALLEQGLPLQRRPFDVWARALARPVEDILATLGAWLEGQTLSRFGIIVRHHELGFRANAMTVFDVPDDVVDGHGRLLATMPAVTLAYRRARTPGWPYNLYCMIHGSSQAVVREQVAQASEGAGLLSYPREVLFSLRRFKQIGGRRFGRAPSLRSCSGPPPWSASRPASLDPSEGTHARA